MKRSHAVSAALLAPIMLAGCDIPTSAPIVEQRWIVPVEEITLGVEELLPAQVSVSGNNFDVSIDPFTTAAALGDVCAACAPFDGQTVPVPPFSGTFDVNESLPADVVAAAISSGTVQLNIANGFSFDPVAGGGSVTVTLTDGPGGTQLGQVVIDGSTESLPSGGSVTKTISLATASVSSFYANIDVTSVGGQTANVGINNELSVAATVPSLLVASATVDVSNQSVSFDDESLDFDFDEDVTSRIKQGTVILEITNPFGVQVDGSIRLGSVAPKTFTIAATGTSTVSISYTGDELTQILSDENATFGGSGTVVGGSITVTPDQQIMAEATIDLTIEIG